MYEFIAVKGTGGKMSSSKGNTVDLKEMKSIYEPSVIRYIFVRPMPPKAFEISFDADVIAIYEAFDRLERVYFGAEQPDKENTAEQLRSLYEFSAVEIPNQMPLQPSFRHITTILQLNLLDGKKTFDHFKGEVKNQFDEVRLRTRISCAKNWLSNYAPEQFLFKVQESVPDVAVALSKEEKTALKEFANSITGKSSEDEVATAFKNSAQASKVELAKLFRAAYLTVLGKEKGPRLFHIIQNIGIEKFGKLVAELQSKKIVAVEKPELSGAKELAAHLDFAVSAEVKKKFPALRTGIVFVEKIDNSGKDETVAKMLREQEQVFKQKYFGKDLSSIRSIKSWREAYSSFDAKPKDYKSSIEALAKRVLKGEQLPSINGLVDLGNYISIKYVLPVGGEDLNVVKGAIKLRFANGTEPFSRIGSSENEPPEKGEVIYADDLGVLCRRFNWRESGRTKITGQTKRAVMFIESLNPEDELEYAVLELATLLEKHCKAKVKTFIV